MSAQSTESFPSVMSATTDVYEVVEMFIYKGKLQ